MSKAERITGSMFAGFLILACSGWGAQPASADKRLRVTEAVAMKAVVKKVEPQYPPIAMRAHITGQAVLDVYVNAEGAVEKVQPVSGNLLLTSAAAAAVKKWKFHPFTSDGKPSNALARIAFTFQL